MEHALEPAAVARVADTALGSVAKGFERDPSPLASEPPWASTKNWQAAAVVAAVAAGVARRGRRAAAAKAPAA